MRITFGEGNANIQPGKGAKSWSVISAFFERRKDKPKPLIMLKIAFFATELLENSGEILCIELNATRYQPMRCKVLTSSIERNPYEQSQAGIKAACKNTRTENY